MSAPAPIAVPLVSRSLTLRFVRWLLLMVVVVSAGAGETVFTFVPLDVPVRVPTVSVPAGSQAGNAQSRVTVSGITGEVVKVTVSMWVTHTWPADLQITLVSPQNTRVLLINSRGGNNRGVGIGVGGRPIGGGASNGTTGIGSGNGAPTNGRVVFDQNAPLSIASALAVNNVNGVPVDGQEYILSGTYIPEQSLNAFNSLIGNQVNGTWTLEVVDTFAIDEGLLKAWTLSITESGAHTWTGLANNGVWETATNWVDNYPPAEYERNATIAFPDFLPASTTPVTRIAGPAGIVRTVNGGLRVRTLSIADGYTISGAPIGIANNGVVTSLTTTSVNAGVPIVISNNMPMFGASFFTPLTGSTINFAGVLSDGVVGTASTVTQNGPGTTLLSNNNDYTGLTSVRSGILNISNAGALGGIGADGGAGTVVSFGATLGVVTNNITVLDETLDLSGSGTANQGALSSSVDLVWDGDVTLSANHSGVGAIGAGVDVQLNNFAATNGAHSLIAYGAGTVILNNALPVLTSLTVNGGQITAAVAQPTVTTMTLNGGTILPTAVITAGGTITSAGSTASTLGAGTINLAGGRILDVRNTLTANATFTNGSFAIRGGGTVNWQSASNTVSVALNAGTMTGAGSTANLSVSTGKLSFAGGAGHNTGNLSLGSNAWFVFNGAASRVTATGAVTISDAVLQPFATGAGQTIITNTNNSGAFRFYPRTGSIVNYNNGTGSIVLGNPNPGRTVQFNTLTYSGREGDGPVQLDLTTTGGAVLVAITSAGGQLDPGGDFVEISSTSINGPTPVSLQINDDFVDEGTESGELIIVPLDALCGVNGQATLTILDNDGDDHKKCGFGTGLTVFLLLGFGLLLNARLRRR